MKLIPFTNDTTHFAQVDDVDFETQFQCGIGLRAMNANAPML